MIKIQPTKCIMMLLFALPAWVFAQQGPAPLGATDDAEILSKRTRNAKTFRKPNGKFRSTISAGALHFENPQGQWQDIETDIVPSQNGNFAFENATNSIRSYYPAQLSGNAHVKIAGKGGSYTLGHRFSFSLDDQLASAPNQNPIIVDLDQATAQQVASNKVIYDGGNSLGYVEYLVGSESVKQQFVLRNLPTNVANSNKPYFSMSEKLSLPAGWSMRADGQTITHTAATTAALSIHDAQGELVRVIPVPEIYEEAHPNVILHPDGQMDQSYFVERQGNDYQIKIAISMSWLTDANRSFPVVIDPNTVVPGGWGGWFDNVNVVQGNPTIYVFVGNLSGTDHLAWNQFDLSSLADTIAVDSVFTSLYQNNSASSAATTVSINDVTTGYGPYPGVHTAAQATDFNNGTYATFPATTSGNYNNIDLGTQAAVDMQCALVRDTFQFAMVNGNQSWKRFTSNLASIDIHYGTCAGAPSISESMHQDLTCSVTTGSATIMATGNGPFTYTWPSIPATGATQTGLTPGLYSVIVGDSSNCASGFCVNILDAEPMLAATSITDVNCNGQMDGTASVTGVTFGTAPYTYTWSNGDNTATADSLGTGSHSVIVVDTFGCTDTALVSISEPTAIVAAASVVSNSACQGQDNGSAMATASGGTPGYSYLWSNGDSTSSISNLAAGTYIVNVTDNLGCVQSDSITITQGAGITASIAIDSTVDCNGSSNGGLTASATGGSGYSYLWSNSGTTAALTGLPAGTYTVTVTDSTGCLSIDSSMVTEPSVVMPMAMVDNNVTCNGLDDGAASASPSGGVAGYGYLWSNGDATAAISGLAPGTYTVVVTDGNGCAMNDTVTITEPAAIDVTTSLNGFTVSANLAGASYQWLDCNNGFAPIPGETGQSFTATANGDYAVAITDSGCTDTSACTNIVVVGIAEATTVFEIFPNPTSGKFKVRVADLHAGDANLEVFTLQGQRIHVQTLTNSETEIDLSGFSKGIYLVNFRGEVHKLVLTQ